MPDEQQALSPDLIRAYSETHYIVETDRPFVLRVGACSRELKQLMDKTATTTATFLTACNPYSQLLSEAENADRQNRLMERLRRSGLWYVSGIGRHPSNAWPGEPSFLVLGMSLEESKSWGADLGQNAILWANTEGRPMLVITAGVEVPEPSASEQT